MASSSSNAATSNLFQGHPVSEKLGKTNHALWKAQVTAGVRGARLYGHLTGVTPKPDEEITVTEGGKEVKKLNSAYADWEAQDQQVLGYLLSSVTRDVLVQVATYETAAEVWGIIKQMYTSHTRARSINTRIALTTTKRGNMIITEYFTKMKTLKDEMQASGKPLDDEDFLQYIITGVGPEFSEVVSVVCARVESISIGELYSQLLNFETRKVLYNGAQDTGGFANVANRGGFGGHGRSNVCRGGGAQRGRGRGGNQGGRG